MPKKELRSESDLLDLDDQHKKKKPRRKASEEVIWVSDPSKPDDDNPTPRRRKSIDPSMKLTKAELTYFKGMTIERQIELNAKMKSLADFCLMESDYPLRFRVLSLPLSDYVKSTIMKKIEALKEDGGESHKLRKWIDSFLRIPFGKTIPLPVTLDSGKARCSNFMKESRIILDDAVFGMAPAKTQIMQVLAQWIANPQSAGNVIALHGPAGVGKTSIANMGISRALKRPFQFFSLGGASDISNYIGHSYTYEGSAWGRIVDSLMHHGCSNPVMYFDELDKISGTPHGEEIVSMLIHLTDRSQNSQFHDRYFAGIDIDMSQCLFVFSFNDINLVNPILRDRMQVIHCGGYSETEKQTILKDYVWPSIMEKLRFNREDVIISPECCKFLVKEYSASEQGIRTLIRTAETIITRLNMLRIADEETMKDYKFYIPVEFPLKLTDSIIKKLMSDINHKEPDVWKSMFT
jgi:ATP-dependent Lon protease